MNSQILLTIFVALTGLAVFMQAFILLALLFTVRKMALSIDNVMASVRKTLVQVTPIIVNAREMLERIQPQIESTIENIASVSADVRVQSIEINASLTEIVDRLCYQAGRADAMLTETLNSVDRVSAFVRSAAEMPARQLSGVMAGIRAVINTLRRGEPTDRPTHSGRDGDFFI